MIRLYAVIIIVGILGAAAWGAKYYYDSTQATINQMVADAQRLNQLTDQLNEDLRKSEEYGDELRATLNKHNLTHLANKKPGLIEQRMQNATDKLWDDLESITGNNPTN